MGTYTDVSRCYATVPAVGSATSVQSNEMAFFIENAEGIINAKLAKLYTVPVLINSVAPPVLTAIATDLALYRALALRMFTQEQINKSVWPDRFKEAMELLDEIAAGEMLLVASGSVLETDSSRIKLESNTQGYTPTFNEDSFLQSTQDPDKLDDIANDRD